jgi:hypothetical protein
MYLEREDNKFVCIYAQTILKPPGEHVLLVAGYKTGSVQYQPQTV